VPKAFIVSRNPARDAWMAGTRPKISATPAEIASAKAARRHQAHSCIRGRLPSGQRVHGRTPATRRAGRARRRSPKHETLREHLTHERPASRAQRRAHRDFATATREPRQHQIRDVGAHDQQQEPDGGRNQQQGGAHRGDELLLSRDQPRSPSGVAVGERRRQPSGDDGHLALRLLLRHAVGQAPDDVEGARFAGAAVRVVRIEAERRPDVDVRARREIEFGGHHADHGVRLGVELNRLADRRRRSTVVPLPEGAAQHGDPVGAGCAFLGGEGAAEHRVGSQHPEHVRGPTHARHVERHAVAGERVPQLPEGGKPWHGRRLCLPVLIGERRDEIEAAVRILLPYDDQPRGVLVGKLIQQHRLDHAEDGGVRADPEHQGEDRHARERGLPGQRANGVANIADQMSHNRRSIAGGGRAGALRFKIADLRFKIGGREAATNPGVDEIQVVAADGSGCGVRAHGALEERR
jgi:hypothetical protein